MTRKLSANAASAVILTVTLGAIGLMMPISAAAGQTVLSLGDAMRSAVMLAIACLYVAFRTRLLSGKTAMRTVFVLLLLQALASLALAFTGDPTVLG